MTGLLLGIALFAGETEQGITWAAVALSVALAIERAFSKHTESKERQKTSEDRQKIADLEHDLERAKDKTKECADDRDEMRKELDECRKKHEANEIKMDELVKTVLKTGTAIHEFNKRVEQAANGHNLS